MSHLVQLVLLLLFLLSTVSVYGQTTGEWLFYENDAFSLAYPDDWEIHETDSSLTLSYESYTLNILLGELRMGYPPEISSGASSSARMASLLMC